MSAQDYDVVIVGGGIAGALAAWTLGQKGVKVLVLEAGPPNRGLFGREDYIDQFKQSPFFWAPGSPYKPVPGAPPSGLLPPTPEPFSPFTPFLDDYWVQEPKNDPAMGPVPGSGIIREELVTRGSRFQSVYERQDGGTTWHWLGTSLRLLPTDFKLASTYNPQVGGLRAYDWPIGYDDLEPWYTLAEKTIGVSGAAEGEDFFGAWRSAAYPMPQIPQSFMDQQIAAAIEGLRLDGVDLQVSSTPQARNAVAGYGGRPLCKGSTSCIPICPIQAKYDATQHLELAKKMSNVTVLDQSVVFRVEIGGDDQVSKVHYRRWEKTGDATSTQDETVTAKVYVLAAHAVENVKILLSSPWGSTTAANSSDQVGRNLADHPVSLIYALVDDPVYPYRGPLSTSGIPSMRDGAFRSERSAFRMEIGNGGWLWPTNGPYNTPYFLVTRTSLRDNKMPTPSELIARGEVPLWGSGLAQEINRQVTRQTRFGCLTEPLPNPDHRVTLSGEADGLGLPRPRLRYGIGEYERRGLDKSAEAAVAVYRRMVKNPRVQYNWQDSSGALVVDTARSDKLAPGESPNVFVREGWAGAGHLMGTHRMGDDPKSSVVDGEQRSHNHKNLFLLGSGSWPSFGTANPTLTIAALALRAAKTIEDDLSSG